MKSPVIVVAITLTAAILVAASLLIFAGTRRSSRNSTLNVPIAHAHLTAQRGGRIVTNSPQFG